MAIDQEDYFDLNEMRRMVDHLMRKLDENPR